MQGNIYRTEFYQTDKTAHILCMDSNDLIATRRSRLRAILESDKYAGNRKKFLAEFRPANEDASRGVLNPSELSGLLHEKFFGEKKARSIEKTLGLNQFWLDGIDPPDETPHEPKGLRDKVLWLLDHMDQEVETMFQLLIAVQYNKMACGGISIIKEDNTTNAGDHKKPNTGIQPIDQ